MFIKIATSLTSPDMALKICEIRLRSQFREISTNNYVRGTNDSLFPFHGGAELHYSRCSVSSQRTMDFEFSGGKLSVVKLQNRLWMVTLQPHAKEQKTEGKGALM